MGSIKFASEMILSDIKQSIAYMLATTVAVAVIFNIFNIIYNPLVMNNDLVENFDISVVCLLVIVACVMFITFANSYFIMEKTKDVAVAAISGRNFVEVATILCFQNLGLGLVGSVLGIILGTLMVPLFIGQLYSAVEIISDPFALSWQGYGFTFLIMGMVFLSVGLIDAGYAYRKEIKELMNSKAISLNSDASPHKKIPNKAFLGLFLLPTIILFLGVDMKETAVIMGVVIQIGVVGAAGIIKYYFPSTIAELRRGKYSTNAVKMISLSNLNYSLKKGGFLIITLSVGCILLIGIAAGSVNVEYKIIALSAYYVVMVLMNIALVYKFIADALSRVNSFKQLKLIGYNILQIKKIIKEEVVLFYGIEIVLTMYLLALMLIPSTLGGILTFNEGAIAFLTFVVVQFLGVGLSYFSYKKIIFGSLD